MQYAGVAFPVSPAGHLGSGAWAAALALVSGVADAAAAGGGAEATAGALLAAGVEAALPLASSLSQARTASKSTERMVVRMRARILAPRVEFTPRVGPRGSGRRQRAHQEGRRAPERRGPRAAGEAVPLPLEVPDLERQA